MLFSCCQSANDALVLEFSEAAMRFHRSVQWRWLHALLLLFGVVAISGSTGAASEFATAQIEVQVDSALVKNTTADPEPRSDSVDENLVACPDALIAVVLDRIPAKQLGVDDWFSEISKPTPTRKHDLQIRDDDYFPKTILIRARDSISDPEYGKWRRPIEQLNGIAFHGSIYNPSQVVVKEAYEFRYAEKGPVKICNGTYHDRLAYMFVVSHSCAGLSNNSGTVKLTEMPSDVDLPMRIQYPWQPLTSIRFDSPTLKVSEKGNFKLRLTSRGENVHVIRILPALHDVK